MILSLRGMLTPNGGRRKLPWSYFEDILLETEVPLSVDLQQSPAFDTAPVGWSLHPDGFTAEHTQPRTLSEGEADLRCVEFEHFLDQKKGQFNYSVVAPIFMNDLVDYGRLYDIPPWLENFKDILHNKYFPIFGDDVNNPNDAARPELVEAFRNVMQSSAVNYVEFESEFNCNERTQGWSLEE
jgi:hypothetical protein